VHHVTLIGSHEVLILYWFSGSSIGFENVFLRVVWTKSLFQFSSWSVRVLEICLKLLNILLLFLTAREKKDGTRVH